mgnify:CR=1 FL=1
MPGSLWVSRQRAKDLEADLMRTDTEIAWLANEIITEEVEKEEAAVRKLSVPKPAEIKRILDDYVVGQDRAKMKLATINARKPSCPNMK